LKKIENWDMPNDLLLSQNDFESIYNSIERLNQFSLQSENTYATVKSIVLELLIFLSHKLETLETFTHNQARPAWLNSFLEKLNSPNVFTMKLKDIYPLAPYSQSMLNIYFNKYVGTTLITYITNLKISYACTLLRYTDASPLEISNKLAYDSLSHFNRVFKKLTYKSPIAYRKEYLLSISNNAL
jgi:AraC-like DNA-binding protein